jgi:pimeloyl-ACP methyl ester carboxylesterase
MNRTTAVSIGPCFGWFHHAEGDRGVVMCATIGYEGLCAHQSWRILADRLAAAGLPTLRFDYPGEGDSLGDGDEPDQLARWRESIRAAVAWMRESIGVREVTIVGLRLGASLAAEVGGVDRLVEIAPVVKGQSYLRELKAMSRMLAASAGAPEGAGGGGVELEGFALAPALCDEIKTVDLARLDARPAPDVLLMLDPSARAGADHAARLEALGSRVRTATFAEYVALTPAPLPAPPPLADFDVIVAFAAEGAGSGRTATPAPSGLSTDVFVEKAVRFGEDDSLAGILCLPRGEPETTVLILNTGANYHIGCGRSAVVMARELARSGVASLRMDGLGIGDSAVVEGGPRATLYREERAVDVSAALDLLARRGLTDVVLLGVCSGATLAVFAGLRDARVGRMILGNIQIFSQRDDETLEERLTTGFGATSTYVSKAMSARSWARVVSGEVSVGKLVSIGGALLRRKAAGLLKASRLGPAQAAALDAQRNFAALARRGARILILHGEHDVGREELELCFGSDARFLRRLGGISFDIVPGRDHSLASPASRTALQERLFAFLRSAETTSVPPRRTSGALFGAAALAALGALALLVKHE